MAEYEFKRIDKPRREPIYNANYFRSLRIFRGYEMYEAETLAAQWKRIKPTDVTDFAALERIRAQIINNLRTLEN